MIRHNNTSFHPTLYRSISTDTLLPACFFHLDNDYCLSHSNAKMREDTLKCLVHVVDKLDEKHLQVRYHHVIPLFVLR